MRMPRHEATRQDVYAARGVNGSAVMSLEPAVGHPPWPTLRVVDEEVETQLRAASARRRRLMRLLDDARTTERVLLFDALRSGGKQVEVVNITGFTREHVRRLADEEARVRGVPRPGARTD